MSAVGYRAGGSFLHRATQAIARHQCGILASDTIAREAEANGVEEILIAERLRKALNGTTLHRLHGHRDVAACAIEGGRPLTASGCYRFYLIDFTSFFR